MRASCSRRPDSRGAIHRGGRLRRRAWFGSALELIPRAAWPPGRPCVALAARRLELVVQRGAVFGEQPVALFAGRRAVLDQPFEVAPVDRCVIVDQPVHDGEGEGGFIALTVAVPPVTPEIDDDVSPKLPAEGHRHPGGPRDGVGIVAVHVKHRLCSMSATSLG